MKLTYGYILGVLAFCTPICTFAAECTVETLPLEEKQKYEKSFKDAFDALSKLAKTEKQNCEKAMQETLPYVEIWMDKDGKTLRRSGGHSVKLTLVVVSDGVVGLQRNFDGETAYDIGQGMPGVMRSYYVTTFMDGKYRVISNVLYVK